MIELKHLPSFPQEIIALDEVGPFPLNGPVFMGAKRILVTEPEALKSLVRFLRRKGIKDSKLISAAKRQSILKELKIPELPFRQTGEIQLKGFSVSLRAMKEAALHLSEGDKTQTTLLIGGHMKLRWPGASPWKEVLIIKGDAKSALIALAAILRLSIARPLPFMDPVRSTRPRLRK